VVKHAIQLFQRFRRAIHRPVKLTSAYDVSSRQHRRARLGRLVLKRHLKHRILSIGDVSPISMC
jgi:hypothetical protein